MMPYDKNFWQISRTFSYWFFIAIILIPYYGIQQIAELLIFCFIDKSDEYQLVQFILKYKKF